MNPVKIFEGSFTGEPLWENESYRTPASHRRMLREEAKGKYVNRTDNKVRAEATQAKNPYDIDKIGREVFQNFDEEEVAKKIVENESDGDDDDMEVTDDEEEVSQQNIERVKKLIEKLRPGNEDGKKLIKKKKVVPGKGKVVKSKNKKSKMIHNIAKTKKLSNKRKLK